MLAAASPAAARAPGRVQPSRETPAAGLVRVAHETYGCADARITATLTDARNPHTKDPEWVEYMMSRGQCALVTPFEPWRVVGRQGNLVRLAAARNAVNTVPLFVQAAALATTFIDGPPRVAVAAAPEPPPPPTTQIVPSTAARLIPAMAVMPRHEDTPDLYAAATHQTQGTIPWFLLFLSTAALAAVVGAWALTRQRPE